MAETVIVVPTQVKNVLHPETQWAELTRHPHLGFAGQVLLSGPMLASVAYEGVENYANCGACRWCSTRY